MNNSNCPYCKSQMTNGFIYGNRYPLKWFFKDEKQLLNRFVGAGEIIGSKRISLSDSSIAFGRPKVACFKCETCKTIIIDLAKD